MSKVNKKQFTTFSSLDFLYLTGTIFIVFLIYSFSLFRPWLPFDENSIYKEDFFLIPTKFEEIFEIINSFILKAHILSMNSFFSNHVTLRSSPLASAITIFISFFFKKNAVLWHLFQLLIHLINSTLVFLIFKKSLAIPNNKKESGKLEYLTISIFTLIWALHSANVEAVLLATNWIALFTYTLCFCFILYEISNQRSQATLISTVFFILMFFTEYSYVMPLIILFIAFAYAIKASKSIKESAINALKTCLPYFSGILLFFLFSIFNRDSAIHKIVSIQNSNVYEFIERNLWFVPQIFIHFIKLLFFPKTLSLYQSNLVHLSHTLISPYSIFCSLSYLLFLLLPISLFFLYRKKAHGFIYPLIYAFYFSIFPFLHIITPTYCLSADRYCYFPSFILLLVLIQPVYLLLNGQNQKFVKPLLVFLSCLVLLLGVRTLIRIQEWNDPYKLYSSAAKIEKNPLYQGQRLTILAYYAEEKGNNQLVEKLLQDSLTLLNRALKEFKHAKKDYPNEPITLKLYGLDYKSLILKDAYLIASIKNNHYHEPPEKILNFLKPYFEKNLNLIGINQIVLYSEILLKAGLLDKVKNVLTYGYNKFDYSDKISNKLAEYYMFYEKDLDKSFKILDHAHNLFPNDLQTLERLFKYYELKNDPTNEAKIAYLLGLRKHSPEYYQLAVKMYLDSNQLQLANKALRKLIRLKEDDPLTLLLTSRYLDLTGQRNKILGVLNSALILSNKLNDKQDINVTKSILISLINVHANLRNISTAKQFLNVFEKIKDLTPQDRLQIQVIKKVIEDIESKQALKSVSKP